MGKSPFSLIWGGGGRGGQLVHSVNSHGSIRKDYCPSQPGIGVSPVVYQEDNVGQLIKKNGYFVLGAASQWVLLLFSEKSPHP